MESKKSELIETENRYVVARGKGDVKVVKMYKLPVIRLISSGDVIYT